MANVVDQEVLSSQVKAERFPFPCKGDITLAIRNAKYALGPVMLHLLMKPGSSIPAHRHDGVVEVLYVLEGDFTNDGRGLMRRTCCIGCVVMRWIGIAGYWP